MPNIMLTYRCNLHCPYCFANEFVNKQNTDISVSNFRKAVDFLTRTGTASIGLIGGEPTLHPAFQILMEMLIANRRVSGVTLYTNGILLDQFIPQVVFPKIHLLVNCNCPLTIGENAYNHIQQNLDTLIQNYHMKDRIDLGINLYSDNMDYSYIIELLQRYKLNTLRISVTVPDFSTCGETDSLEYFRKRKQFLLRFLRDLDSIHVMPYYDCNRPPYCIWTEEEKEWLEAYVSRYPDCFTNLTRRDSRCVPVIDILPNLQAVRCFGMSDFIKVPIEDFQNASDLQGFFLNEIDANASRISACRECKECYERKIGHCIAGCMGFKASRIRACNEAIDQM